MDERFKDCKANPLVDPVSWFNQFGEFISIFDGIRSVYIISDTEVNDDSTRIKIASFRLHGTQVEVCGDNSFDLSHPMLITKFMLFTAVKFKGNYNSAMAYVLYYLMKKEIPYFRVGCDYFKLIKKKNYLTGGYDHFIKSWRKEELKQDYPKDFIQHINKYDDFTIVPNNKGFQPVVENCYNIYSKFPHKPFVAKASLVDIPATKILMSHIFGDQIELGFKYIKVLYEHPMQILPVLVLGSTERGTGKTTFLDWIAALFGENSVQINPEEITSDFNSGFALKNIIIVDETTIDKSSGVERIKTLATQKRISVNPKFVQQYSVPFYGKVIMATNKEKEFMKIDDAEIRFWVRKCSVIPIENHNIQIDKLLIKEIPKLLRYITDLPSIDFSKSRMVFTDSEIWTEQLERVKSESKSWLKKELELYFQEFFDSFSEQSFQATAQEIKNKWYNHNHQASISFISKVLKDEFKLQPSDRVIRYTPFYHSSEPIINKPGRPYTIINTSQVEVVMEIDEMPF